MGQTIELKGLAHVVLVDDVWLFAWLDEVLVCSIGKQAVIN